MESYQIITLKSGQPLILYQENEKVYMYTVFSGRIRSYGIVFDDVAEQLLLSSGSKQYAAYLSTNGKLKLYRLSDMRFVELLTFPGEGMKHTELKQLAFSVFDEKMLLFYLTHNLDDSSNALFYIDLDFINKSSFIFRGDYSLSRFSTVPLEDSLLLILNFGEKTKLLLLNKDRTVEAFEQSRHFDGKNTGKTEAMEQVKEKLKEREDEITSLKETSKERESEITSLKETSKEREAEITSLKQKLYEKENEISSLESTQKHIANQYNELAEFAGQLQDELRKTRYL